MPPRPHKPCRKPGCSRLTQDATGYCPAHMEWGQQKADADLAKRRQVADDRRGTAHERGYNAAWRNVTRGRVLSNGKRSGGWLRANPICAMCGKPATVVDHIIPHRGDSKLFWDTDNWQPLCARCHNKKTARGE